VNRQSTFHVAEARLLATDSDRLRLSAEALSSIASLRREFINAERLVKEGAVQVLDPLPRAP